MASHQISIRFPGDLYTAMETNAAERGMTVTQWLRWAARTCVVAHMIPGNIPLQGMFHEEVNYQKDGA